MILHRAAEGGMGRAGVLPFSPTAARACGITKVRQRVLGRGARGARSEPRWVSPRLRCAQLRCADDCRRCSRALSLRAECSVPG